MKELYNSHDSSANVPALNQNASPIDAPLFLRFTGSEEPSNIPVIKVKTMLPEQNKDKIPHVILLPGIEGITPILKHLCRKLQTNVSCMRYCVDYKPESITELAKSVLPVNQLRIA